MAKDNHLLSVTCYNVTMISNKYYNEFFELGQQKINFKFFEWSLPDNDPVYTLKNVMEEMEFSSLRAQYLNKGRNGFSCSKTELEATFMRMKEDHVLNGQLKPAYNVQIAVENYFIIHSYISNDRTDYNTLIPVIQKHFSAFGEKLKEVTADSGYCGEKNLLFLKEHDIESYIKLQEHEKRKTRAYKEDIGKYYNMSYHVFEDEHYYVCHDGIELRHIQTEKKTANIKPDASINTILKKMRIKTSS